MKPKRILITAGGTGGHIYPALALAEELTLQGAQLLFAGHGLSRNAFFNRSPFEKEEVLSGTLSVKRPFRSLLSLGKIVRGTFQALSVIRRFRPDVVVGFGSYHTMPVLLAAKLVGVPIIVHEQNAFPGRVNRLAAPFAKRVAIHFPESAEHLKASCSWVGMPLRSSLREKRERSAALSYFELKEGTPTLLVFGGSLGAKKLNELAASAAAAMGVALQVIHLTGSEEERKRYQAFYEEEKIPASVKCFEERMEMAWAAADCAVTRAGAVTIAELVESAVPAVTVPYPFAQDNHQEQNARALFRKTAGGICLREKELTAARLREVLECMIEHRKEMREALIEYRNVRPKESLAALVWEVIECPN